jgi:hypothetical protein
MKRTTALVSIAALLLVAAPAVAQLTRDAAIAKAETVLKNLQDGKTAEIVKEFDARMARDLPEDRLKSAWPGLVKQFGAFKTIGERREGQMEGRQAVELFLAFEKETIVHRTVFDAEGKIGGLVFRPAASAVLPPGK